MSSPYAEYDALRERARQAVPRFVSPSDIREYAAVISSRGSDWCSAVIGRPFSGLRQLAGVECQMLVLADRVDLDPPLPAAMVESRARAEERARALDARRAQLEAADIAKWREAVADCTVSLEVRENLHGRRTGTALATGPLRHAVPTVDVVSGSATRPRSHPAGRAVCETVQRARPRQLGEPTDRPATCVSCVKLVPRLRLP